MLIAACFTPPFPSSRLNLFFHICFKSQFLSFSQLLLYFLSFSLWPCLYCFLLGPCFIYLSSVFVFLKASLLINRSPYCHQSIHGNWTLSLTLSKLFSLTRFWTTPWFFLFLFTSLLSINFLFSIQIKSHLFRPIYFVLSFLPLCLFILFFSFFQRE